MARVDPYIIDLLDQDLNFIHQLETFVAKVDMSSSSDTSADIESKADKNKNVVSDFTITMGGQHCRRCLRRCQGHRFLEGLPSLLYLSTKR